MKKFLVFFVFLFGLVCSAMAGYQGEQPDAKGGDGYCVFKPEPDDEHTYAIYFKTGESNVSSECASSFNDVKQELAELWNDGGVSYFVVVASADQQGDSRNYDNDKLSKDRYDYAVKNILPSSARIANWVAGSASNKEFAPQYTESWSHRSVYIYPVWERAICDQELVNMIKSNVEKLEGAIKKYPGVADLATLLKNYKDAQAICDSPKKLTATQANNLSKLLAGSSVLLESVNTQYNINLEQTTVVNAEISRYYSLLAEIRAGLKINEWRDAEGKFNTARLASDSIAGVVLGTVGGIVTSKLVKKNQLKKGFEDLDCNVGGQKVADYGDTFRVGLQ